MSTVQIGSSVLARGHKFQAAESDSAARHRNSAPTYRVLKMPNPRSAKPPELRTLIGAVAWGFAILAVAWIGIVVITRGDDKETAQQFFDRHRTDLDRVAEL
ncbi:MAG: hypothetical protein Q7V57_01670, partial [Actinomycetota bacterium]|nr:hypothetical protein [Actinomycetota bacterium]